MIVTLDLSNATDIHGTDKHAVGERLASWALASLYGKTNVPASGPLYRSMQIRPWGVEVTFDQTDGGLVTSAPHSGRSAVAGRDRAGRWRHHRGRRFRSSVHEETIGNSDAPRRDPASTQELRRSTGIVGRSTVCPEPRAGRHVDYPVAS